ncbi:MAG TPA: BadF/BadG/BcrA/BcrD ATPase family protein [Candidatus Angelobacter sp.]
MSLFLGIDAGGTKTESAVSNGAELLGQATCASCKVARVGEEEARHNLHQVILRACEAARVTPQAINRVCIGMAGASPAGAMAWAERTIRELVPGQVKVTGDHIVAYQAAFGTLPGVLVIAGTGSIAYGRNEKGETARAGGWGPAVSDEGSAFWIGREAVVSALRLHDRASNNGLLSTISELWQAGSPEEVLRIANSDAPVRFAELATAVSAAAEAGDATAQTITVRAGKELAALAGTVITRLWPARAVVRVAMTGGVLQGSSLVRRAFQEAIQAEYPNVALSFAYVRPVLGALAIAALPGALK